MVVVVMVCGRHDLWPSWFVAIIVEPWDEQFVNAVTDTSRPPFTDEEETEGNYIFVTYETMLADITMHAYLEYGSYEGALYGTKLDTVRQIHADGLMAVIDVEPQVNNSLVLLGLYHDGHNHDHDGHSNENVKN